MAGLLALALAFVDAPAAVERLTRAGAEGQGFATAHWRDAETTRAAARLGTDLRLVSNSHHWLAHGLGRAVRRVPARYGRLTARPRAAFARESSALCADLREGQAALVWYADVHWAWDLPTHDELWAACPGLSRAPTVDGEIWRSLGVPPGPEPMLQPSPEVR